MPAVEFDVNEFRVIYPQFADITDAQLNYFFEAATILVDNSGRSKVPYNPPDVTTRKTILYALVCHLATLSLRGGGVVGTLSNAAEGSVSTGFAVPQNPNAAWYNQTQCGAFAYQLMVPFIVGGRSYNGCFR